MSYNEQIENVKNFIKENMGTEFEMHDYLHAFRVLSYARSIMQMENVNKLVVETAALVHDFVDQKFFKDIEGQNNIIKNLLRNNEYRDEDIEHIINIINNMSYYKGKIPESIEGKIVQDADRLDALLAIGVLRPFTYGTKFSRPFYDSQESSLSHFIEKKLKLEDTLNTEEAKKFAKQKSDITYIYLAYLLDELPDDIYEKERYKDELASFYQKYDDIIPEKVKGRKNMNEALTLVENLKSYDEIMLESLLKFYSKNQSNLIKDEFKKLSLEEAKKICNNLSRLYYELHNYEVENTCEDVFKKRISMLTDRERLILKDQIIYFLARIHLVDKGEIFRFAYKNEVDLRIKRITAMSGSLSGCEDIEIDYIKNMTPGSKHDIVNRSAALVYHEDVKGDFFEYQDDKKNAGANCKNERFKRLGETTDKAQQFRLFDIKTLHNLFISREWADTLNDDELLLIINCSLDETKYSKEKLELFKQIRNEFEKDYSSNLEKQRDLK